MGLGLERGDAPLIPQRPPASRRLIGTLKQRIQTVYRYDTPLWRLAIGGSWTLSFLAFAVTVLGIPTGFGIAVDLLLAAAAGTLTLAVAGNVLALLLALAAIPVPRLYTGCVLSGAGIVFAVFYFAEVDSAAAGVIAAGASLLGAFSGLFFALLYRRRFLPALAIAAAAGLLTLLPVDWANPAGTAVPFQQEPAGTVLPVSAANPSLPGGFAYTTFTYGSGKDLHRPEYGEAVSLLSSSADASAYITKWPRLRSLFWGFSQNALPLNARVWMPKGDGPYPLVLLVHGNHMMEDFSDGGYGYLGELLASRGFIAISLDENFVNYSAWSGIPDNDMKVRTWLILKHLEQISAFAGQPGNPFYGRVDTSRTAIVGHSRGGQAAAMAADARRWFKDDPVLAAADRFRIAAVAALAPTDKNVDDRQAKLSNVSYLTLQGARDGDVHIFYGDRQYNRASYSPGSTAFKASLYIGDANHSQFNTDWGLMDLSLPAGLFLDRGRIMDGEAQRTIAKVYVSAFMETALHETEDYLGLFQDYRSARQWLPDTVYFNRYESGGFAPLVRYDEDRNKSTAGTLGTISAEGLRWNEEPVRDRQANSKGTFGAVLERGPGSNGEAYYRITLPGDSGMGAALSEARGIAFSLSNRSAEITDKEPAASPPETALPVEVELTDASGVSVRLPLDRFRSPQPLPFTRFTWSPMLEERVSDGKYGDPREAVFQTYRLPFGLFRSVSPALMPERLASITFHFRGTAKIMLDDVGFYRDVSREPGLEGAAAR